ncbi:MAG: Wadjet anti-phage system protein JetA family protein [Spirochaetota bacterium]
MPQTLFSEVPESFFIPLASMHRRHYSQLLMRYYRLFETFSTGVERELVIASFEEYISEESELTTFAVDELLGEEGSSPAGADEPGKPSARNLASAFLRRLISYGWMSEEILSDYTQVINITMWSRPFYTAIAEVIKGLDVEYESHVIGIYSSVCSDAAAEQGHHAILNALDHTRRLIESLKTLSQNIKTHIGTMFHEDAEVKELLHIHYDLYMQEIVDKAYNRLKTSDNLSKYRPQINKALTRFLADDGWLSSAAAKLAGIKNTSSRDARALLVEMIKEIKDELRNIDPILEEIDDKNRQYSRISTEKIKSHLYADASLHGKVKSIMQAVKHDEGLCSVVQPNLTNVRWFSANASLYYRKRRRDAEIIVQRPTDDSFNLEMMETEMRLRIRRQLGPEKIRGFLDRVCNSDGSPTFAADIVEDMEDFIRVLYAAAYAEGRESSFPYRVLWKREMVRTGRFEFREHSFVSTVAQNSDSANGKAAGETAQSGHEETTKWKTD